MSDEEIARVLAQIKDPQRAADELKRIVHERGADDNLTAVIVQVGRARQSAVLAIEDGMAGYRSGQTAHARAAEVSETMPATRAAVAFKLISAETGRHDCRKLAHLTSKRAHVPSDLIRAKTRPHRDD